jgi:HTH-type transcriptional regulator, fmd operon transcriptional regulator
MTTSLLTQRQQDVLRYRQQGLTLQQIADIVGTSKVNICMIEKAARENIQRAMDTLESVRMLDARPLCTLKAGLDLFEVLPLIYADATRIGITIPDEQIELINRLRTDNPNRIQGRYIKEDITIYIGVKGEIYSG